MAKISMSYIIEKLRTNNIYYVTPETLAGIFNLSHTKIYPLIKRLKRGKLVVEVEKGKYFLLGFEPEKVLSNPFYLANKIHFPSYISFWTALNYYGFTEQVPFTVFVAATVKRPQLRFNKYNFKYIKIAPHKFFGYEKINYGDLPMLFADPEKAIIDSLDQPQYAGGISEIAKCIENAYNDKAIRLNKLIGYAVKMKNKTLCSRLGFLLERLGVKNKSLIKHVSKSFVLLDANRPRSDVWNRQWRLNVNLTEQELSLWKET